MYSGEYLPIMRIMYGALCAFILSLIFVPIARIVARKLNILDIPDGKVKQHKVATPYLGGVAVYLGTLIPSLFLVSCSISYILLLLGCTTLLIVGLIDDIVVMKPGQKFIGQFCAMILFLCGGFYLHLFTCSFLGIILSALWILTVINAFNLIDVMDGLATLVACGASCGFILIALYFGQYTIAGILLCFAGSLVGFLLYNWPHASIYLGDTGSLFIGGLLGALPLCLNVGVVGPLGYLAPVILLAIPLLELTTLIVIRTYKKIPFYQGSPDHFSIYLQQHGWSKKKILFYMFIMMTILIVIALAFVAGHLNIYQVASLAAVFLFIWAIFLIQGGFWRYKNHS